MINQHKPQEQENRSAAASESTTDLSSSEEAIEAGIDRFRRNGPSLSGLESDIVGSTKTLDKGRREQRPEGRNAMHEPNKGWWHGPLSDWVPETNREILLIVFLYNVVVVFLARYTDLCGDASDADEENHVFCSDSFVLLEDKVLTGFTVGMFLLLAFRANQAYDRFWEGRKMWGRMREVSRDFTRFVCTHIRVETQADFDDRRRAVNFVTCFAAATKLHLRKERDINRDIQKLRIQLCPQDIANIQHADHMPIFCQDVLSFYLNDQVKHGRLSEHQLSDINQICVAVMSDVMGSCERIANTPIPLSYVLQLRFFLILWLILYPLHIVAYYGWWTILLTCLMSFAVLGIESMSSEIENPFGYDRNDLDLDKMVSGFYVDTQAILKRVESKQSEYLFNRKQVLRMSKVRMEKNFLASAALQDEEVISA